MVIRTWTHFKFMVVLFTLCCRPHPNGQEIGLPDYVTSECYGDIFNFDCGAGNKIRINKDFFGHNTGDSCQYQPGDCVISNPRSNSLIHRYCTGRRICTYYLVERRACDGYFSNYQQVEYQCVPEVKVTDICSRVHYEARSTYISSPNFPENYPPNLDCKCVISAGSSKVQLEIVYLAIKFTSPCRDWLRIGRWRTCGTTVDLFDGHSIPIEFHSDSDDSHSGFWLHFQVSDPTDRLIVKCGNVTETGRSDVSAVRNSGSNRLPGGRARSTTQPSHGLDPHLPTTDSRGSRRRTTTEPEFHAPGLEEHDRHSTGRTRNSFRSRRLGVGPGHLGPDSRTGSRLVGSTTDSNRGETIGEHEVGTNPPDQHGTTVQTDERPSATGRGRSTAREHITSTVSRGTQTDPEERSTTGTVGERPVRGGGGIGRPVRGGSSDRSPDRGDSDGRPGRGGGDGRPGRGGNRGGRPLRAGTSSGRPGRGGTAGSGGSGGSASSRGGLDGDHGEGMHVEGTNGRRVGGPRDRGGIHTEGTERGGLRRGGISRDGHSEEIHSQDRPPGRGGRGRGTTAGGNIARDRPINAQTGRTEHSGISTSVQGEPRDVTHQGIPTSPLGTQGRGTVSTRLPGEVTSTRRGHDRTSPGDTTWPTDGAGSFTNGRTTDGTSIGPRGDVGQNQFPVTEVTSRDRNTGSSSTTLIDGRGRPIRRGSTSTLLPGDKDDGLEPGTTHRYGRLPSTQRTLGHPSRPGISDRTERYPSTRGTTSGTTRDTFGTNRYPSNIPGDERHPSSQGPTTRGSSFGNREFPSTTDGARDKDGTPGRGRIDEWGRDRDKAFGGEWGHDGADGLGMGTRSRNGSRYGGMGTRHGITDNRDMSSIGDINNFRGENIGDSFGDGFEEVDYEDNNATGIDVADFPAEAAAENSDWTVVMVIVCLIIGVGIIIIIAVIAVVVFRRRRRNQTKADDKVAPKVSADSSGSEGDSGDSGQELIVTSNGRTRQQRIESYSRGSGHQEFVDVESLYSKPRKKDKSFQIDLDPSSDYDDVIYSDGMSAVESDIRSETSSLYSTPYCSMSHKGVQARASKVQSKPEGAYEYDDISPTPTPRPKPKAKPKPRKRLEDSSIGDKSSYRSTSSVDIPNRPSTENRVPHVNGDNRLKKRGAYMNSRVSTSSSEGDDKRPEKLPPKPTFRVSDPYDPDSYSSSEAEMDPARQKSLASMSELAEVTLVPENAVYSDEYSNSEHSSWDQKSAISI